MPRLTHTFLVIALSVVAAVSAAEPNAPASATQADGAHATFAGGCFWCMEPPFDKLDGVRATISGFAGGHTKNPTYKEVTAGGTGHVETVQVTYDPSQIDYAKLLDVYWRNVDPVDGAGQFCDRGESYRPAIFYHNDEQRRLAEQSKAAVEQKLGQRVAVTIEPVTAFYPAEEYHQNYYQKNPLRYQYYRYRCGRDARLEQVWGDKN